MTGVDNESNTKVEKDEEKDYWIVRHLKNYLRIVAFVINTLLVVITQKLELLIFYSVGGFGVKDFISGVLLYLYKGSKSSETIDNKYNDTESKRERMSRYLDYTFMSTITFFAALNIVSHKNKEGGLLRYGVWRTVVFSFMTLLCVRLIMPASVSISTKVISNHIAPSFYSSISSKKSVKTITGPDATGNSGDDILADVKSSGLYQEASVPEDTRNNEVSVNKGFHFTDDKNTVGVIAYYGTLLNIILGSLNGYIPGMMDKLFLSVVISTYSVHAYCKVLPRDPVYAYGEEHEGDVWLSKNKDKKKGTSLGIRDHLLSIFMGVAWSWVFKLIFWLIFTKR